MFLIENLKQFRYLKLYYEIGRNFTGGMMRLSILYEK